MRGNALLARISDIHGVCGPKVKANIASDPRPVSFAKPMFRKGVVGVGGQLL